MTSQANSKDAEACQTKKKKDFENSFIFEPNKCFKLRHGRKLYFEWADQLKLIIKQINKAA